MELYTCMNCCFLFGYIPLFVMSFSTMPCMYIIIHTLYCMVNTIFNHVYTQSCICTHYIYTCRLCYFTASSINRKTDFMRCLTLTYKAACLTCSLTDTQLAEFIQFKKRNSKNLRKLFAVSYVGLQLDGSWVLSHSAHVSPSGLLMDVS